MKLERLEEIKDLRTVWPHEAYDFTPWLAENIGILGDTLGLKLRVDKTEAASGMFNLDILATDLTSGSRVVIENQLEYSDHDHLGKLITYASSHKADIIIWVVKNAREEHRAAVRWLNRHTDNEIQVYLCEVKLYKVCDNLAVKFDVVVTPKISGAVDENESKLLESKQEYKKDFRDPSKYEYWSLFDSYSSNIQKYVENFGQGKARSENRLDFWVGVTEYHIGVYRSKKRILFM